MKNSIITIIFSVLSLSLHAQQAKKVLFIIADGIPADVIESVPHPNLDKIAKAGAYKRAYVGGIKGGYSQTPTISAVSYNSLLTGTWVNKHNVWGNDIKAPNYTYPTIFKLLHDQYPMKKTGIFSTWTDNRTKLVGEGLPQTGKFRISYIADGYELDTVTYPHDKEARYINLIDGKVAEEAAYYVREHAPDLSWVYLEYTDDMGHRYGTGAKQNEAIGMLDKQVGKIWEMIEYRKQQFNEDWLILVTTDHGRDSVSGHNHGGQSARERTTWLYTNAKNLNSYFQKNEPAITDLLPTIARHLNINLPKPVQYELDGTALTGPVTIANAKAEWAGDSVRVTWNMVGKDELVKIFSTATNLFKEGSTDVYSQLTEIPARQERFSFVPKQGLSMYKIVLETASNTINTWLVLPAGAPIKRAPQNNQ